MNPREQRIDNMRRAIACVKEQRWPVSDPVTAIKLSRIVSRSLLLGREATRKLVEDVVALLEDEARGRPLPAVLTLGLGSPDPAPAQP